jgi:hypothetical protein
MSISKNDIHQIKYARGVVATGRLNVEQIVTNILTLHGANAIDPARTDAEIRGHCDLLARTTDEHQECNQALIQSIARGIQVREQRDVSAAALHDTVVGVRRSGRDNFKLETLRIYRMDESIPVSHEGLAKYVAEMHGLLVQNPYTVTDVLGKDITTTELATILNAPLQVYRTTLDDVVREAREAERARMLRDQSASRFRRVLHNVAAIVAGYLRLAGLDELADRIRPTRARTSGAVAPELPDTDSPVVALPEPPATEPAEPVTKG